MAGNKLSPRQKMIGMMYLVLIALLALNVSKTVLEAFSKINGSLYKTSINFANKNNQVYAEFDQAAETNPTKAGPWKEKAYGVKKEADELVDRLQRLKFELVSMGDGKVNILYNGEVVEVSENTSYADLGDKKYASFAEIENKKDRYEAWNLMYNEKKEGDPLMQNINSFKSLLLLYASDNESISNSLNSTFDLSDIQLKEGSGKVSWLKNNFEDMPLIAAVTILSKIQADVRNAEADVINFLRQEIDASSLKFTSAEAIQIAPSNYIFLGDTFKADVFIAAKDSTQNPVIYVGDYELGEDGKYNMVGEFDTITVKSGKGKFAIKTRSEGYKKWGGLISMKTDAGVKMYPFSGEYQVAKQSVVVSPTKMNVLYILGDKVGNPVDISVPGVSQDKISASCNNGKIVKKGASWEVYPTKVGPAKISISAEIDGKRKNMGAMEFRVKRVPDPIASLPGLSKQGKIKKNQLTANSTKLIAEMKDFDFDLKFRVTGFTIAATYKGNFVEKKTRGAKLTDEMKELIKDLQRGSTVFITNISAKGPDGKPRQLGALPVKIN